eukprot:scaffold140644_cov35-Tisochrysis_lutea.AAC.2
MTRRGGKQASNKQMNGATHSDTYYGTWLNRWKAKASQNTSCQVCNMSTRPLAQPTRSESLVTEEQKESLVCSGL